MVGIAATISTSEDKGHDAATETSHCNSVCIISIISAGPMRVLRLGRCRATLFFALVFLSFPGVFVVLRGFLSDPF